MVVLERRQLCWQRGEQPLDLAPVELGWKVSIVLKTLAGFAGKSFFLVEFMRDSFDAVWSYDGTTHPQKFMQIHLKSYCELDVDGLQASIECYQKGEVLNCSTGAFRSSKIMVCSHS